MKLFSSGPGHSDARPCCDTVCECGCAAPVGCRPLGLWRLQNLAQRRECPAGPGWTSAAFAATYPEAWAKMQALYAKRVCVTHPRRCGASNDFARLSRAKFFKAARSAMWRRRGRASGQASRACPANLSRIPPRCDLPAASHRACATARAAFTRP